MEKIQIPDVSGLRLKNALKILKNQGMENVTVRPTAPPRLRGQGYNDDSRVIRQSAGEDGSIELLVCNINI